MWCDVIRLFLLITFHQKIWILVRFTENTSKCCLWNCSKIGMSISSSSDELWVKSEPKYPVLSVQRYFLKLLLTFSWYMINESSHPSATTANMDEKTMPRLSTYLHVHVSLCLPNYQGKLWEIKNCHDFDTNKFKRILQFFSWHFQKYSACKFSLTELTY